MSPLKKMENGKLEGGEEVEKWKSGKVEKDLAASALGVEVNKEQGSYPTVLLPSLVLLTLHYFILNQPKLIYSMIAYSISFYIPFSNIYSFPLTYFSLPILTLRLH